VIKSKPQTEYLLQIEPSLAVHSGWMVPRKHADIEPLHEYLYKIANVSGAPAFARKYQYLPPYKGKTKEIYRRDLEKYLHDALSYEPLAESEGMKRFLDKDQGFEKSGANRNPLAFAAPVGDAFQTVGKGVLGGFSTASKGVAAGGQAVLGGVGGLFGGPKKSAPSPRALRYSDASRFEPIASDEQDRHVPKQPPMSPRASTETRSRPHHSQEEDPGDSGVMLQEPLRTALEQAPPMPPRPSEQDVASPHQKITEDSGNETQSAFGTLPTPPASIRDSIASLAPSEPTAIRPEGLEKLEQRINSDDISDAAKEPIQQERLSTGQREEDFEAFEAPRSKSFLPLDEQETCVAIELMFAAISELYTLSSAWNIRRTLLNAAKNYLLRPGNPSLRSITDLLQSTVLDANTSDKAIAEHVLKMRQNSMPTESELAAWPAPLSDLEKEDLRVKARKLLVTKGMPQALTSVMGTAASGEALGRVFDALQVKRVCRALAFALLLQGLRAVTT